MRRSCRAAPDRDAWRLLARGHRMGAACGSKDGRRRPEDSRKRAGAWRMRPPAGPQRSYTKDMRIPPDNFDLQMISLLPRLRIQALALTRNASAAGDLVQDAVVNALAARG